MNIVINFRETKRETIRSIFRAALALTMLYCANLPNFAQSCMEKNAVQTAEGAAGDIQKKRISSHFSAVILTSADDAARIAAANDREGRLMQKLVETEAKLAKRSITGFLPQFDFALSDSATVQKEKGDYKSKAIEAGVTQKIFNGGKSLLEYKMQIEKSLYDCLENESAQKERQRQVIAVYHRALLLKLRGDVLKDAAQNAATVFETACLEAEQGMISSAEFLKSQVQFMKMQADANAAQSAFLDSCRALSDLMGLDSREKIFFEQGMEGGLESKSRARNLNERLTELTQAALENSVALKKARAEASWSKKRKSLMLRSFLPSVSLRAGVSLNGRNWPLSEPAYSFKVILGFDNNPWLPMSLSKSAGLEKGSLASMSDAINGKGVIDLAWPSQYKLSALSVEKALLDAEKKQREIESQVFGLVQSLLAAEENARLKFEASRLKEKYLELYKIQLEQGEIKMTDWLEELAECSKEKINWLEAKIQAEELAKTLEDLCALKL